MSFLPPPEAFRGCQVLMVHPDSCTICFWAPISNLGSIPSSLLLITLKMFFNPCKPFLNSGPSCRLLPLPGSFATWLTLAPHFYPCFNATSVERSSESMLSLQCFSSLCVFSLLVLITIYKYKCMCLLVPVFLTTAF